MVKGILALLQCQKGHLLEPENEASFVEVADRGVERVNLVVPRVSGVCV